MKEALVAFFTVWDTKDEAIKYGKEAPMYMDERGEGEVNQN